MEASDEILDVRLLSDAVSGASITDDLYSFGVPKATANPNMAANPRKTDIIILSFLMILKRLTTSIAIFFFNFFSSSML